MALATATVWEIRTAGSDNNGGGFVTGSTGTDFSQQDAAQYSNTDLVIAATNTKVTSAAHSFGATDVGNLLQIISGTNFTAGFYQILSVAGGTGTLDRAAGTAGSTAGTYSVGGALLTLAKPPFIGGNTVWVKAGTYTSTATITHAATKSGSLTLGRTSIKGYQTARGDGGTPPVFTSATNSIVLWSCTAFNFVNVDNIKFTHTAATRGAGIKGVTTACTNWNITNCIFDGCLIGVDGSTKSIDFLVLANCCIKNSTSYGMRNPITTAVINSCIFYNNVTAGYLNETVDGSQLTITNSIFAKNTGRGYYDSGTGSQLRLTLINNTFVDNTQDGFRADTDPSVTGKLSPLVLTNNIFYGNSGWGVLMPSQTAVAMDGNGLLAETNAYGSNTVGARSGIIAGTNDITLSADPFVSRTVLNYMLNNTAGGGASCRAAGYPKSFLTASTTGYLDIGAAQHLDSGTSSSGTSSFIFRPAGMQGGFG